MAENLTAVTALLNKIKNSHPDAKYTQNIIANISREFFLNIAVWTWLSCTPKLSNVIRKQNIARGFHTWKPTAPLWGCAVESTACCHYKMTWGLVPLHVLLQLVPTFCVECFGLSTVIKRTGTANKSEGKTCWTGNYIWASFKDLCETGLENVYFPNTAR